MNSLCVTTFISLTALLLLVQRGMCDEFEVDGSFKKTFFNLKTGAPSEVEGWFKVFRSAPAWLIRTYRQDENFDYVEVGTDNDKIYMLQCMDSFVANQPRRPRNNSVGLIYPGPVVPHTVYPIASVLWLAYASSEYFDGLNDAKEAEPICLTEYGLEELHFKKLKCKVDLFRNDSPPHLPKLINYYDDGFKRYWAGGNIEGWFLPFKKEKRAPPYDLGFTNSSFEVLEFITVGGSEVPGKFSFKRFYPKLGNPASNRDLHLLELYEFNATNTSPKITLDSFKPKINGTILVADKRFAKDPEPVFDFSYSSVGVWLTDAEVKRLPEYKSQLQEQVRLRRDVFALKRKREGTPLKVAVIVAVMGLITLAFFLYWRRGKSHTNQ